MAAEDGGFMWLVGSILSGLDAGFDYGQSAMGTGSWEDGQYRYVESSRNDKGERGFLGIVETPYQDWRDDNRNVRDLRDLYEPDQGNQPWWSW